MLLRAGAAATAIWQLQQQQQQRLAVVSGNLAIVGSHSYLAIWRLQQLTIIKTATALVVAVAVAVVATVAVAVAFAVAVVAVAITTVDN